MSDFSGLEQSFALPALPSVAFGDYAGLSEFGAASPAEVRPHELSFRRLRGPQEIARILHLRDEIRLPSAIQADAGFAMREKKETSWAWSGPSSASARR